MSKIFFNKNQKTKFNYKILLNENNLRILNSSSFYKFFIPNSDMLY